MIKIIEVENLSFNYGNEPILDKIGFSVFKGDFMSIIGSNGTGKSTLIKLLIGELTADYGKINLLGKDIKYFKNWPQIGYVSQKSESTGNFPATAEEIVKANLFSQIGLMKFPRKQHRDITMEALSTVGMEDYAKRLIGNLSGGQLQRVMIARVLVNNPQVMLLDEPITGIDAKSAVLLYELLSKLNQDKGITIVMVTHDVNRAINYVNRTLCLEDGSIIELKKDQVEYELQHKHRHPITTLYVNNDIKNKEYDDGNI